MRARNCCDAKSLYIYGCKKLVMCHIRRIGSLLHLSDMATDILIVLGLTGLLSLAALALFGVRPPKHGLLDCVSGEKPLLNVRRIVDARGAAALEMASQSELSVLIAVGAVTVRRPVRLENLRVSVLPGRICIRIQGLPRARLDLAPVAPGDWEAVEDLIHMLIQPRAAAASSAGAAS